MKQASQKLPRREFVKKCAAAASVGLMAPSRFFAEEKKTNPHQQNGEHASRGVVQHVYPLIGTGWRGHMFPGAVAPFGFVQLSPDTSGAPEPRWNARGDYTGWNHCSGYYYPDNVILGFSHTHLQGTGGAVEELADGQQVDAGLRRLTAMIGPLVIDIAHSRHLPFRRIG